MGKYTNVPTLHLDFLKIGEFAISSEGDGIDGGRNGEGDSPAIDFSGGGKLVCSMDNCYVQAPEEHEYANHLAAYLNGSKRYINVPFLTDWMGPFPVAAGYPPVPQPIIRGIPHSDGALFSDDAGYSQSTVFGTVDQSAPLGAGKLVLNVFGATRQLRWSDWFSIFHPTRGWRAYRYWESSEPIAVTRTVDGVSYSGQKYTVALDRPLREAVSVGVRIEFARPLCVMRFPRGFNLEWRIRGFWQSSPSLKLVEAEVR